MFARNRQCPLFAETSVPGIVSARFSRNRRRPFFQDSSVPAICGFVSAALFRNRQCFFVRLAIVRFVRVCQCPLCVGSSLSALYEFVSVLFVWTRQCPLCVNR